MRLALDVLGYFNRAVTLLCGLLLVGMVVSTFLQVIVRFILTSIGINIAVPWSEEISRYLMIWIIFLGAAVACRQAQLISLEFLIHATPPFVGRLLRYLALLICLGFFLLLIQIGIQFVEFGRFETSPVLSMPKIYVYLALPVGAALMIVNTLALLLETWVDKLDIRNVSAQEAME